MDDSGASLVKLLLRDPHFLKSGKRGQNGTSNPDRVFSLGRGDDLDLHRGRGHAGDLLLHAIGDTRVHRGTSGQDSIGIKILSEKD